MPAIRRILFCYAALLATGDLRAASGDRATLPSSPVEIVSGTGIDNDFRAVIRRDPNRRITSVTRGNVVQGYVTQTYARGPGGRITAATSTVAGAPAFSYTQHDAQGRRTHVTTNKGTWTYDYRGGVNGDGQVVSATNPGLGDFHYSFDGIGRRTAFTLPGQNPQLAAGNTLNQIHQATWPQSRDLRVKAHPDARVWLNGVEKFSPPNWLDFDGEEWYGIDSPGPYGGWVGWDVLAVLEGGGDAGANPDRKSRKTGHLYFPPAQETFTYDEDGNRTGSARWTYAYDGLNRMTRAVNKDLGTAPEAWDITFSYDAEGRRHGKTARQYADGTHLETLATTWTWDGWHPVVERTVDSHNRPVVERRMVWGPDLSGAIDGAGGAGGLLLIREKTWTLDGKPPVTVDLLPLHDGSGNIVGLAGADGTLKAEYWYGPFGELIEAKGPKANSNPYRWAGKYHDAETGLVYFGLRYYDPATGQWLSREPLGEGESVNLYAYCHNDPINRVDVLGASETSFQDAVRVLASPEFQRLFAQNPTNWGMWRSWFMGTLDGIAREHLDSDEKYRVLVATANQYEGLFRASLENHRNDHNYAREMLGAWDLEQRQQRKAGEIGLAMLDTPIHIGTALASGGLMIDATCGATWTWNGFANGGGWGLEEVGRGERGFAIAMAMIPIGRVENMADDVARVGMRTERTLARATEGALTPGRGLPKGITFDAIVHRAVNPKYVDTAFDFHAPSNLGASHRYTDVGRGGIYSGTSREAVLGELAHYGVDPSRAAWVTKSVRVDNVLDLTNPAIREQLGISLDQITGDSYLYTHALGDFARGQGYGGILFPSARATGTSNLVEFINHVR